MATNAVAFNGTTQYGKIDNFTAIDSLTDVTVEFWVKNHASSAPYDILHQIADATNYFTSMSTENGTGNEGFNMSTNYAGTNADGYEASSRITAGSFVHIAFVHDNTIHKTSIFIDGKENAFYNLQQTGTSTLQSASGMALFLAADGPLTKYAQLSIGGFVRVWNRALNGAELYNNYNLSLDPAQETGLIVNCNFSEGSGTVIDNDATPGADINLIATPTWETGPTITAKSYTNEISFNQVSASTDDAEEARGSTVMSLTSGDYEIPADGGVSQRIGWRFLAVAIPAGATIQAAYIRLLGTDTLSGGPVTAVLAGNDVDDASTFTSTNGDISGRTATSATVNWSIGASTAGGITTSPDIKTIIQEIIDRAGWATGQDMAFMLDGTTDTGTYGRFFSWNGQAYSAAMLHIEYTTSVNKTFTIDGIVKEIKTNTFTIDGLVTVGGVLFFNIDGIVQAQTTNTFTIDGVVRGDLTNTFTIDGKIATRINVVPNPSFEDDTPGDESFPAGWNSFGSNPDTYRGVIAENPYSGIHSFKIAATATQDTGIRRNITVVAGQEVTVSVWAKSDADLDTGSFVLSNEQNGSGGNQTYTNNWSGAYEGRRSITITPVTTSLEIFLGMGAFGGASNGTVWFDAVLLEIGATALPYFDGSRTQAEWQGTEHGSKSSLFVYIIDNTFTIDGYIVYNATFTIDGIVVTGSNSSTFTIDGIVKEINQATFTIDGIVKAQTDKTFTIDGIVQSQTTKTFTIDAYITTLSEYLKDLFDSGFDSAKWNSQPSTGLINFTNKEVQFVGSTSNGYNQIESVIPYDLRSSYIKAKLINAGSQAIVSNEAVLYFSIFGDSANKLYWVVSNGAITARKIIAGVNSSVATDTYNSAVHKWLKIRESGGTIYWDYSTDGITYSNFTSLANPFAVNSVAVALQQGTWQDEGSATTVIWDSFNVDVINNTFTIDGIVQASTLATFTIDGLVSASITFTFTIDALVLAQTLSTFTIDAIVKAQTTNTFTIDAVVKASSLFTFTIDAVVQAQATSTFTIDGIVKTLDNPATFTIDGIVKAQTLITFTIDGLILASTQATFTIDAIVLVITTSTFTIDAIIKASTDSTFTIDALVKAQTDVTFTIDGIIRSGLVYEFTIDGIVLATQTTTFTIDAVVLSAYSITFTIDGIVKQTLTSEFTIDGIVLVITQSTFTIDAIVKEVNTASFTIDAIIKEINSASFTIDGIVLQGASSLFTIDAIVKVITSQSFTIDAVVRTDDNLITFTIDGLVLQTQQATFTIDGIVYATSSVSFTIDALIQGSNEVSITIDAVITERGLIVEFTIDAIVSGVKFSSPGGKGRKGLYDQDEAPRSFYQKINPISDSKDIPNLVGSKERNLDLWEN